jgi:hypothetical protein
LPKACWPRRTASPTTRSTRTIGLCGTGTSSGEEEDDKVVEMVQEDGPFQANPNPLLRGEDSDDEV